MAYNYKRYSIGEEVLVSKALGAIYEVVKEHITYSYTLRTRIRIIGSKKSHWENNKKYKDIIGKDIWMYSTDRKDISYYSDDGDIIDCILYPTEGEYKHIKYVPTRKVIVEKIGTLKHNA